MPAYDYETQQWITDETEAAKIHLQHLRQDREIVAGPDGPEYLRSIGNAETVPEALARIDGLINHYRTPAGWRTVCTQPGD